jgi:hypothetical protein
MRHDAGHIRAGLPQAADKALDTGILVSEAILLFEILPDALRGKPLTQSFHYLVPVRLTGTRRAGGHPGRFCPGAGGHFGRFWVSRGSNADRSYFERVEDIVRAIVGVTESSRGIANSDVPMTADLKILQDSFGQRAKDFLVEFIKKGQEEGYCNPNLSAESIEACVGVLIRGINADPEMHSRVSHDPKLFHDMLSIILAGLRPSIIH